MSDRIKMGDRARDMVSGWEGIVTSRHEYLNGCVRWQLEGKDKDGKPEGFVFDEQQIEVLEEAVVTPIQPVTHAPEVPSRTGGPRGRSAPSSVGH